jgi:Transposase DDE domain
LHTRLIETGGEGIRVRRLGKTRAGEIRLTRFLRNKAVTLEEMTETAASRTAGLCAARRVLAIQDTTVVASDGGGGLYLHPVVALDADDGAILGLIHARFLNRDSGRKALRRSAPIEDKESHRWLEGANQAAQVCAQAHRITVIADRESDIFEAFAQRPAAVDLLIRAAQDRALADGGRLFARADALPEVGRAKLELPARPGRRAREAVLAVRFMKAELARPKAGVRKGSPKSVGVTLVDAREIAAPAGEPAAHWRLLTTHVVSNAAEAFEVADLYRRRWAIEQLFRTLKTQGFDIEGLRIEETAARCKLTMAALIAAVSVQQLVHARDGANGLRPPRLMTDAFEAHDQPLLEAFCADLEGKTQRQKNPHPKGSLAYAAWVCARLGGWTGYYGKPGPIVMLSGWLYFHAAKHGAALINASFDV